VFNDAAMRKVCAERLRAYFLCFCQLCTVDSARGHISAPTLNGSYFELKRRSGHETSAFHETHHQESLDGVICNRACGSWNACCAEVCELHILPGTERFRNLLRISADLALIGICLRQRNNRSEIMHCVLMTLAWLRLLHMESIGNRTKSSERLARDVRDRDYDYHHTYTGHLFGRIILMAEAHRSTLKSLCGRGPCCNRALSLTARQTRKPHARPTVYCSAPSLRVLHTHGIPNWII
jgi:hypothetical protein